MVGGCSQPDPFLLSDSVTDKGPSERKGFAYRNTTGLTRRSQTVNTGVRNLILLVGGQSLCANTSIVSFTPTNSTVVDQMNIYDGAIYNITGPLFGATLNPIVGSPGFGNISVLIADTLVTNNKFDRVIICCTSIGSTLASVWGNDNGIYSDRLPGAMLRLKARGIVPGMTNVTFACLFDLGEQDLIEGTTQSAMMASLNGVVSKLQATGFNGRIFIPLESNLLETSNRIRTAQALVRGGQVFAGGDFDAIPDRSDGIHWNAVGGAAAAAAVVSAMAATGAPF